MIGWEAIEERVKKGRTITTKTSFQLRAWEVVLGAGLVWLFYGAPLGNGKSFFSFDPFNVLPADAGGQFWTFDPFHILGKNLTTGSRP